MTSIVQRRVAGATALMILLYLLGMVLTAQPAGATHVTPTYLTGNPNCEAVSGTTEVLRLEDGGKLAGGTFTATGGGSITISNLTEHTFDWSATDVVIAAVFVKAGNAGNLYDYTPDGATSDTGLGSPNENPRKAISHITFCVSDEEPERGTIIVEKETIGSTGSFEFTGDLGTFLISTTSSNPNTATFSGLVPGTYGITEVIPDNWNLTSLSCGEDQTVDLEAGTATVNLAAGETVTCLFQNTFDPPEDTGTVVIVKETVGGFGTFYFDIGGLPQIEITTSELENPASAEPLVLDAGEYVLTEDFFSLGAGWRNLNIECAIDGQGESSTEVTLNALRVDITLAAGDTVTCTFTNSFVEPSVLLVHKQVEGSAPPANATFDFEVFAVSEEDPHFSIRQFALGDGETEEFVFQFTEESFDFIVEESDPGSDWDTEFICTGDEVATSGLVAEVTLTGPGGHVECTFTNTHTPPPPPPPPPPSTGTIEVVKAASGSNGETFVFDVLGDREVLTDGSVVTRTGLAAGTYVVSEDNGARADGWSLESITCTDPSGGTTTEVSSDGVTGVATIDLAAGETVRCVFTNVVDDSEVLGTTVTTSPPEVAADTLPFTGFEPGGAFRLGVLAIIAGALLLYTVRGSKREDSPSPEMGGWSSF